MLNAVKSVQKTTGPQVAARENGILDQGGLKKAEITHAFANFTIIACNIPVLCPGLFHAVVVKGHGWHVKRSRPGSGQGEY